MWWHLERFVLIEIMEHAIILLKELRCFIVMESCHCISLWLYTLYSVWNPLLFLAMYSLFLVINFVVFSTTAQHTCVSNLNFFFVSRKAERDGKLFARPLWHEHWQLQSCSRSEYRFLFYFIPALVSGSVWCNEDNIFSSWKKEGCQIKR
jgi:hypothetical protein